MWLIGLAVVLALSFTFVSLDAEGQQAQGPKAAKIGFLLGGTLSTPSVQIEPFKQTLRENGWIEGQNLTLEYRPEQERTWAAYEACKAEGRVTHVYIYRVEPNGLARWRASDTAGQVPETLDNRGGDALDGERTGTILGDGEIAAHLEIVDLEPNAALRSVAIIGQLEVFGPAAAVWVRRPGPRVRRERGRVLPGSPAVAVAQIHRQRSRATARRHG